MSGILMLCIYKFDKPEMKEGVRLSSATVFLFWGYRFLARGASPCKTSTGISVYVNFYMNIHSKMLITKIRKKKTKNSIAQKPSKQEKIASKKVYKS